MKPKKPLHPNIIAAARRNNKKRHEETVKRYYQNPNTCKQCGVVIRLAGAIYNAMRKQFCSHACAAVYSNKGRIRSPLPCPVCDTMFKPVGGKKHCSIQCHWQTRNAQWVETWLRGEHDGNNGKFRDVIATQVRRWLFKTRGEKCERCGWRKTNPTTGNIPLQINHRDGRHKNTRPENLEILCPNCHSLTSNFGGANRGNGREGRRYRRGGIADLV